MSELPAGGRVPQRRAAAGGDDAPPAEVSGGSLEPAVAQPAESASGAMAARRPEESPESRSRARFLREICMAVVTRFYGNAPAASAAVAAAAMSESRAREAREGPTAASARPLARGPEPGPVSTASLHEQLGLLGIREQQLFRQYLDSYAMIPVRLLRDFEARRRLFVEGCKAREAAFDADPPQLDSEAAAFTVALGALHLGFFYFHLQICISGFCFV
uniref:EP300 interacting inhibitor of differentiation 2B n=1 Tax=Oryctolagus cuniculus TaxID=9986 RepID=G1TJL1_RABIT